MIKTITAATLLLSSTIAFADPTIFNMQLAKTTEAQAKKIYNLKHTSTNKYSNGNMYSVPTSAINFEGLKEVTVVFDDSGVLAGVLTVFPKSKYEYLSSMLSKKYKITHQLKPFVGDKSVTYVNGGTNILLNAPHMSFELTLNYIRNDVLKKFNQQSQREQRQKQQHEASQL